MHVEVPIVEVGSWICAVEHRGGDGIFIRADLQVDQPAVSCDGMEAEGQLLTAAPQSRPTAPQLLSLRQTHPKVKSYVR